MSYTYRVVKDFPLAAYPMSPGETTAYADISGNAYTSNVYGTPAARPPLVSGGGVSYYMTDANGFRFSIPVFVGADVGRPFTLEAWFKHVDSTGTVQILGHDHADDGITWNGDAIRFTTKHGAAGSCVVEYYPSDVEGAFHVIGVHNSSKNELYVNGVLRGATELTESQLATPYTTTSNPGFLYAGHAISGTGGAVIDSVAVYDRMLNAEEILDHYFWAYRVTELDDVVSSNGGILWTFTDNEADLLFDKKFDTKEEWNTGNVINMAANDSLTPTFEVPAQEYQTVNVLPVAAQSFEDGTTGGWTLTTDVGGTIANSTAQAYAGTRSLLLTKGTGYAGAGYATTMAVNYGTSYVFSAWIYPSVTTIDAALNEVGTGGFGYSSLTITGLTANTWQRVTRVYTPTNENITSIQFNIGWQAAAVPAGSTVYIDAVQLETGTVATDYTSNQTELNPTPIFSIAGTWNFGLLADALDTVIDGSKIEWDGDGTFTVETSIDNEATWSPAANGREVVGVSNGFVTDSKYITVRVSIPAGLPTTTPTVLRSLTLKLYRRRSVQALNADRLATPSGATALSPLTYQPIQQHDGMGLDIYGGRVVIAKDVDDTPTPTRTAELWIKFNETPTAASIVLDGRDDAADPSAAIQIETTRALSPVGGVLYVNGAAYVGGTAMALNQWYHLVFVLNSDNSNDFTLGARYNNALYVKMSLGFYAAYPTALSAASITQLYNNYMGIPGISVVDTSVINVFETNAPAQGLPAKIYAYNWSISPAG